MHPIFLAFGFSMFFGLWQIEVFGLSLFFPIILPPPTSSSLTTTAVGVELSDDLIDELVSIEVSGAAIFLKPWIIRQ